MRINSFIWRAVVGSALFFAGTTFTACNDGPSDIDETDTSIDLDGGATDLNEDVVETGDSDSTDIETADLSDGDGTTNACSPSTGVVLAGSYIVGVETSLNRNEPFIFRLNVEESAAQYDLELQALVKDDCPSGVGCANALPRTEAGNPVAVFPVVPDSNGVLRVSFAGLVMPGSANSGTGTTIDADINLELDLCSQDRLCGVAEIVVNSLGGAELSGTVAAQATKDFSPEAVPMVVGNCGPPGPICGDEVCDDSEDEASCAADCEPEPATCYTQDSELPTGVGEKVDGLSQDGDDLCDRDEAQLVYMGTDCSTVADCDGDGINDDAEILFLTDEVGGTGFATDVVNPNTDEAGENDGDEIASGGDPTTNVDNIGSGDVTPRLDGTAYGYVSRVELAGSDCCFTDLDDDAGIDNDVANLARSLNSVGSLLELDLSIGGINERFRRNIEIGALGVIAEFRNLPLDVESGARDDLAISLFATDIRQLTNESCSFHGDCQSVKPGLCKAVGGQGLCAYPADMIDVRRSGDGTYSLDSFMGEFTDGFFRESRFLSARAVVSIPVETAILPLNLINVFSGYGFHPFGVFGVNLRNVEVTDLRARGVVVPVPTDDGTTFGLASENMIEVGGAIPLPQIVEEMDAAIKECFPSFQGDLIFVDPIRNSERLAISCADPLPASVEDPDGLNGECSGIGQLFGQICGLLDAIYGSNLSVDTDGDGKRDAFSFGARVELSGAANTTDESGQ